MAVMVQQQEMFMSKLRHLRNSLGSIFVLAAVFAMPVSADDYSAGWGPVVGSQMPPMNAPDQAGVERTLADLSGEQGLLLFLNRSADW
jgi:hypothetical protein